MEHDEQNGMNPEVIGKYIANIVKKKKPAIVYVASAKYKFLKSFVQDSSSGSARKNRRKSIWLKLYSCSSSGSPSGSWKKVMPLARYTGCPQCSQLKILHFHSNHMCNIQPHLFFEFFKVILLKLFDLLNQKFLLHTRHRNHVPIDFLP